MIAIRASALTLGMALLAGCTGNDRSIYWHDWLPATPPAKDAAPGAKPQKSTLVTIDAKQRAIIAMNGKVCTEPPPDVFSAYAQALGASGSLSKQAAAGPVQASGSLSFSSSEQAATIARTQAYNLLALQTYYYCLTTMNASGGSRAADLEMPIDRARLQHMVMGALAIEQLTGALRPPTVVIGASGSASTGAAGAMEALAKAKAAADGKAGALDTASAAAKKLDDGGAPCDKADSKECADAKKSAKDNVEAAQGAKDAADKYYAAQLALSGGGSPTGATTTVSTPVVTGGATPDQATVKAVADTVKDIVAMSNGDETTLFCIRLLYPAEGQRGPGPKLAAKCEKFLLDAVGKAQAAQDQVLERVYGIKPGKAQDDFKDQVTAGRSDEDKANTAAFDIYWAKVGGADKSDTAKADAAKVKAVIDAAIKRAKTKKEKTWLAAMGLNPGRVAALAAFTQLPEAVKTQLGK